jgi:hypothetical protein
MKDHYVLCYIPDSEYRYYSGCTAPGWTPERSNTTDDLQSATVMDLGQARRMLDRTAIKADWEIWKIKQGIALDRHV